jgi:hypothetical protein
VVLITQEQDQYLRAESERTNWSMNEIVRRAIDRQRGAASQ